jgi:hypothetical protein
MQDHGQPLLNAHLLMLWLLQCLLPRGLIRSRCLLLRSLICLLEGGPGLLSQKLHKSYREPLLCMLLRYKLTAGC